jgi:hypothetical protein
MIYKIYANMSHVLNRCETQFFIPTEYDQHTSSLTVLQDSVPRVIVGHKTDRAEVTRGWRKLLRERPHYFCYSPKQSFFIIVESRKMKWTEQVARVWRGMRRRYEISIYNLQMKIPLERRKNRWDDNIEFTLNSQSAKV